MATVNILGPGRVGSALSRALLPLGWTLGAVITRTAIPETISGDVLFVTVPDAEICSAFASVADRCMPGMTVAHCAGAQGSELWDGFAIQYTNLHFGAMHPLQTVPTDAPPTVFAGVFAAIDARDDVGAACLRSIAASLEMVPVAIPGNLRTRYHAAATIASNHVTALIGQVERIVAELPIPLEAFAALSSASVSNAYAGGAANALTGPVRRGDLATVQAHMNALPPEERMLYQQLAIAALRLVPNPAAALTSFLEALSA